MDRPNYNSYAALALSEDEDPASDEESKKASHDERGNQKGTPSKRKLSGNKGTPSNIGTPSKRGTSSKRGPTPKKPERNIINLTIKHWKVTTAGQTQMRAIWTLLKTHAPKFKNKNVEFIEDIVFAEHPDPLKKDSKVRIWWQNGANLTMSWGDKASVDLVLDLESLVTVNKWLTEEELTEQKKMEIISVLFGGHGSTISDVMGLSNVETEKGL